MKLLLDSHLLLWWPQGSAKLGPRARQMILDNDTELFMSAASWWELGLKVALGKLEADLPVLRRVLGQRGVATISVTVEHGEIAAALPLIHRDPFDHMLVAQAQAEGLRLLTRDKQLRGYGATVLLV